MRLSVRIAGLVGILVVLTVAVPGVGHVSAGDDIANNGFAVDTTGEQTQTDYAVVALEAESELGDSGESEDETGRNLIGDWWGLGGETGEAPYIGIAEIGIVLLVVGVLGYSIVKRNSIVPVRLRRYQLPTHQWVMLVGTALTLPHFVAVEEWEGVGLILGVLLGVEVVSGLYGRYLHRHVIRLGRGAERAPILGTALNVTKEMLFTRWRQVHVLLTVVTGLALVLHVVTAVGD